MRILADLAGHVKGGRFTIVQVEKVPPFTTQTPVNGKFPIPVPPDCDFAVDATSYVLDGVGDVDGLDVASRAYAHLLARFPMMGNIYFNPLLTKNHVGEFDLTAYFKAIDLPPPHGPSPPNPPVYFYTRAQTGRASGLLAGQAPATTALLAVNPGVDPPRPGLLVTQEIDLGPYTLDSHGVPVGADEFIVYWKLYGFETTADLYHISGPNISNQNAVKRLSEVPQEPADFAVYISIDGENWCRVGLLEPIAFCRKSKSIRLAFLNNRDAKVYLASYAVMF